MHPVLSGHGRGQRYAKAQESTNIKNTIKVVWFEQFTIWLLLTTVRVYKLCLLYCITWQDQPRCGRGQAEHSRWQDCGGPWYGRRKHKHKLLYAVRLVYLGECTMLLYKHIHTNLHGAKNRENESEALDDKTVKADWKRWNFRWIGCR